MEWDSTVYIGIVDYEKAFGSLDIEALWKCHCEISEKYMSIIQSTYEMMTCNVSHAGQLTYSFKVKIGVWQVCFLSQIYKFA